MEMERKNGAVGLEIVMQTTDPDLSQTWSFVLTALRIPHRVVCENHVFSLIVPSESQSLALRELEEFFQETRAQPSDTTLINRKEGATLQPPTLLLVGSLVILYAITGPWNSNSIWFQKGAGDSQAILQHAEWFRLVTALTLHANLLHLVSNCILGGFLLHFFLLLVGTGIGLFAMLLAAVTGNGINVLLHGPGHIFVGFSTAIFAVVGMLATLNYKSKGSGFQSRLQLPLVGAFALLAMLGSSGEHTDLGAHLFGLLSGLVMGKILRLPPIKKLRRSFAAQTLFFLISLSIFSCCWIVAFIR